MNDNPKFENIEIIKELRNKFGELKAKLLEEKEKNNSKIPFTRIKQQILFMCFCQSIFICF